MVYQESKFIPDGESWAGARGLMQLMPATAKRFGATDPGDPKAEHEGRCELPDVPGEILDEQNCR